MPIAISTMSFGCLWKNEPGSTSGEARPARSGIFITSK